MYALTKLVAVQHDDDDDVARKKKKIKQGGTEKIPSDVFCNTHGAIGKHLEATMCVCSLHTFIYLIIYTPLSTLFFFKKERAGMGYAVREEEKR